MKTFSIKKTIDKKTEFKEEVKELSDIYIYLDNNKKNLEVFINDELKVPINLEKLFIKKYSKMYKFQSKRFFDNLIDVVFQPIKEETTDTIIVFNIVYEIKDTFIK